MARSTRTAQTLLRMSDDLKDKLSTAAKRNSRTLTSEINERLQFSFDDHKTAGHSELLLQIGAILDGWALAQGTDNQYMRDQLKLIAEFQNEDRKEMSEMRRELSDLRRLLSQLCIKLEGG